MDLKIIVIYCVCSDFLCQVKNQEFGYQMTDDIQGRMRKRIETVFSEITALFPKTINAVTGPGFEIKIFNFILAYTFRLFFKLRVALE